MCQSPRCHHYSLWLWHRVSTQLRACCTVHDVPSFHLPIISTVWGGKMQSSCWTSAEFRIALSLWLLIQITLPMITCHYFGNRCKYRKLTRMRCVPIDTLTSQEPRCNPREKAPFIMSHVHWWQKAAACNLPAFWNQVIQRSFDVS